MDIFDKFLIWNLVLGSIVWKVTESTCTFPDDLKNRVFEMRYRITTTSRAEVYRTIKLSTTTVEDFLITAHSENRDQWTCHFSEGDNYVLKSDMFVDNVGTDSFIYFGFKYYPCVTSNGIYNCLIKPLCDAYSSALDEQVKLIPATSGDPTTISEIQGSSVPDAYYLLTPSGYLASIISEYQTQANSLFQNITDEISSLKSEVQTKQLSDQQMKNISAEILSLKMSNDVQQQNLSDKVSSLQAEVKLQELNHENISADISYLKMSNDLQHQNLSAEILSLRMSNDMQQQNLSDEIMSLRSEVQTKQISNQQMKNISDKILSVQAEVQMHEFNNRNFSDELSSLISEVQTKQISQQQMQSISVEISSLRDLSHMQRKNLSALVQNEMSEKKTSDTVYDIVIYVCVGFVFIVMTIMLILVIATYQMVKHEMRKGK